MIERELVYQLKVLQILNSNLYILDKVPACERREGIKERLGQVVCNISSVSRALLYNSLLDHYPIVRHQPLEMGFAPRSSWHPEFQRFYDDWAAKMKEKGLDPTKTSLGYDGVYNSSFPFLS